MITTLTGIPPGNLLKALHPHTSSEGRPVTKPPANMASHISATWIKTEVKIILQGPGTP